MLDSDYKHIAFCKVETSCSITQPFKYCALKCCRVNSFQAVRCQNCPNSFEHSRLCWESLGVRRLVPDEFLSVVMNIIWARGEFWGQISTDLKVLHRCLLKARSAWLYCKYICRQHPLDAKTGLELCGLMSDSIQSQLAIN